MNKFRKYGIVLSLAIMSSGLMAGCDSEEKENVEVVSSVEATEESTEESTVESTEESTTESTEESTEESTAESTEESTEESIAESTEESTEESTVESTEDDIVDSSVGDEKIEKVTNANSELGDNIYSYSIEIDGQVLTFPMMASDLRALGYECKDDETHKFSATSFGLTTYVKDERYFNFYTMNFDVNAAEIKDCAIVGIVVDDFSAREKKVVLPGGITMGESTMEEARALYGTPSDTYESDTFPYDRYVENSHNYVKIMYNHEKGDVVKEFTIQNFEVPANFKVSAIDTESVPEIVSLYNAPTQISDNLYDYTFEYAGDLYTFPAPVSAFIDNGWTIKEDKTQEIIEGSGSGKLTLTRDNQQFWTYVRNYDLNATPVENTFIVQIEANVNNTNVSCAIGNNIYIGADESAVENLEGYTVEKEESNSYNGYTISDERSRTYHYYIVCKAGKVTGIEVKYDPRVKEYRSEKGVQ